MIECFFWIPLIELLYGIVFLLTLIFNFIVDCWWIILLIIVAWCVIANFANRKTK